MDIAKYKALIRGLGTFVPFLPNTRGTGGTDEPLYCYGVWLRHVANIRAATGMTRVPETVAELGPGDSLGIGLMALLTGAARYVALDRVPFASIERNVAVFDRLVELLQAREPIPGARAYPAMRPAVADESFPVWLEEQLDSALAPERVRALRAALATIGKPGNPIEYHAPWIDGIDAMQGRFDLLFSQAVLEHVDDLAATHAALLRCLRPGGLASHQIDFGSHGLSDAWNGQWSFGDVAWRITRGSRPFLINRLPHSRQLALLRQAGFRIVLERREERRDGLQRDRLAPRFVGLDDADLATKGAYLIVARAP